MLVEFTGGPSPWEDLGTFIEVARKRHPNATNTQRKLNQYVARATVERPQRAPWLKHVEFGADILSNEFGSLPAYQFFTADQVARLLAMPIAQRHTLITIPGLEHTYIWLDQNQWLQDVSDHDIQVIRHHPRRHWFSLPEKVGYHVDVRSYDGNGIDEFDQQPIAKSPHTDYADEIDRVIADRELHGYIPGASFHDPGQE
jgi:hypothetical protein